MTNEIKCGDVVRLKSGSPAMTAGHIQPVESELGARTECSHFNKSQVQRITTWCYLDQLVKQVYNQQLGWVDWDCKSAEEKGA